MRRRGTGGSGELALQSVLKLWRFGRAVFAFRGVFSVEAF